MGIDAFGLLSIGDLVESLTSASHYHMHTRTICVWFVLIICIWELDTSFPFTLLQFYRILEVLDQLVGEYKWHKKNPIKQFNVEQM